VLAADPVRGGLVLGDHVGGVGEHVGEVHQPRPLLAFDIGGVDLGDVLGGGRGLAPEFGDGGDVVVRSDERGRGPFDLGGEVEVLGAGGLEAGAGGGDGDELEGGVDQFGHAAAEVARTEVPQ